MTAPAILEQTDALAALEFDIVCGWGTSVHPNTAACSTSADWLILGHDCTAPRNLGEFLLCDAHLAQLRAELDGTHTHCRSCGLRARTFNEWIYRVIGAR
jgi:hypothetical protein